jgi:hypothetical protein
MPQIDEIKLQAEFEPAEILALVGRLAASLACQYTPGADRLPDLVRKQRLVVAPAFGPPLADTDVCH